MNSYKPSLGISNFNIWSLDHSLILQDSSSFPHYVCSNCIDNYSQFFTFAKCAICLDTVPSHNDTLGNFARVAIHRDTNYHEWHLCNTCANIHWQPSISCFCGKIVREAEMIKTYISDFTAYFEHNHHKSAWEALCIEANVTDDSSIRLVINKACTSCVGPMGSITESGKQAFINLYDSSHWDNAAFPLSNSNIVHHDYVIQKDIKVYEQPTIVSYVKNQNVGKIGYVTKYNELF